MLFALARSPGVFLTWLACLFLASGSLASAQELPAQQKAIALANLKKVGVEKPNLLETANLIVCSSLPAAKAKLLADSLEKAHAFARKALQYEPKEEPWKGKLTVYVFTERSPFTLFMLRVAAERNKETVFFALKGDEPYLVNGVEVGAKPTDAELQTATGKLIAVALITAKVSTAQLPEWVRMGFGRAVVARLDGPNSKRMFEFKAKSKAAVLGGRGRPPADVKDVWGSGKSKEDEILETSLMDYLAFGPNAEGFSKFLDAFRPSEAIPMPTFDQVLTGLTWKPEDLDKTWKKYVQTGK